MTYDFEVITMKTKEGKTLYLKASDKESKNIVCEWTFDKQTAIWFEIDGSAEKFAKSYFRTFNKWIIENIKYTI